MTRKEQFMPNDTPKHIRICDNGGKSIDRYTVVYAGNYQGRKGICHYVGMSNDPYHPQGFGQHGESKEIIDYPKYSHLGKKITFKDLSPNCKDLVIQDYKKLWRI